MYKCTTHTRKGPVRRCQHRSTIEILIIFERMAAIKQCIAVCVCVCVALQIYQHWQRLIWMSHRTQRTTKDAPHMNVNGVHLTHFTWKLKGRIHHSSALHVNSARNVIFVFIHCIAFGWLWLCVRCDRVNQPLPRRLWTGKKRSPFSTFYALARHWMRDMLYMDCTFGSTHIFINGNGMLIAQ